MAKINIIRYTGRPVDLEDLAAYEAEFKQQFDAIEADLKSAANGPVDMLEFQKRLAAVDTELYAKYKTIGQIEYPNTRKKTQALVDLYGCPLAFARASDGSNELVAVIWDKPFGEG